MTRIEASRGAYGLSFGEEIDQNFLVDVDPSWPRWHVRWSRAGSDTQKMDLPVREQWSPDQALLAIPPEGFMEIDRAGASTTLHLRERPPVEALIHPLLSSTGIVAGHWLGRTPFHGGAFLVNGRAWGVLGDRDAGKSSVLMGLHRVGVPILTDDLLLVDATGAYAGPRCIDLRKSAAAHFQSGGYLGTVGARERWRVELPAVPARVPFGGWIRLDWSDEVQITAVPLRDRLATLAVNRGLRAADADMSRLLDLLDAPMVAFSRAQDWSRADEAIGTLLEHIERSVS